MPEQPQRSWFGRHWKWALPVGCLTPVAVCGGFVALILSVVFGAIKSSTAYTDSLATVRAAPQVQQAIGQPMKPAYFVTGNINTSPGAGHADIVYSVTGPKGSASVHAVADKAAGKWTFYTLDVTIGKTGKRFDLLPEDEPEEILQQSEDSTEIPAEPNE